jgi:predicted lipoprotein with Yx(FWY)xxD motif
MRRFIMPMAAIAGLATAALVGVAIAKTFTLNVASHAKVTNQMGVSIHEAVVTGVHSRAVYSLTGDSKSHPECKATTKPNCFKTWPPVTEASGKTATKAAGIVGKLGTWKRNGFVQITLAGHPLYYYSGDTNGSPNAFGEGIVSFGGTWHVHKGPSSGTGTTSTMTTTTTTTMPCIPYPGFPCP